MSFLLHGSWWVPQQGENPMVNPKECPLCLSFCYLKHYRYRKGSAWRSAVRDPKWNNRKALSLGDRKLPRPTMARSQGNKIGIALSPLSVTSQSLVSVNSCMWNRVDSTFFRTLSECVQQFEKLSGFAWRSSWPPVDLTWQDDFPEDYTEDCESNELCHSVLETTLLYISGIRHGHIHFLYVYSCWYLSPPTICDSSSPYWTSGQRNSTTYQHNQVNVLKWNDYSYTLQHEVS